MLTYKSELIARKNNGKVYTPSYIVKNILDLSNYQSGNILKKHIIDNSCGDGAFLKEIVDRYCCEFLKHSMDIEGLTLELSEFIHGIELNQEEHQKCINNLNFVVSKYGIQNVKWDIKCDDTLLIQDYNGKMDFVVGNPPYVRIHNLEEEDLKKIKKYNFSQNGMTDLFIVFFEIGLKMLNENGILGYIVPNSLYNSLAASVLRQNLIQNKQIQKVVDLRHYQPFNATTYTTILIISKYPNNKEVEFFEYDSKNKQPIKIDNLLHEDFYINNSFYFSSKEKLLILKKILTYNSTNDVFDVKNGFATLYDDFFIGRFNFSEYVIPVVKASTGEYLQCLFPYINSKIVPIDKLMENQAIREYYEKNIDKLKKRSLEKKENWHGFGRSQGINDVFKPKFSINTLIKDDKDIKLVFCEPGIGVYSGLYILTNENEKEIKDIIFSSDFILYISMLGKYKNNGYYTFSSKDLKKFLNFKYFERRKFINEQLRFFANT
jgi:adenine-specific DNA-methyltransferase